MLPGDTGLYAGLHALLRLKEASLLSSSLLHFAPPAAGLNISTYLRHLDRS